MSSTHNRGCKNRMLEIDKYSRIPIYEQLISEFERMIISDEISVNEPMPSVRILSQQLSVNPNTLQKAYAELEHRGLCFAVPGNGRFITKEAKELLLNEKRQGLLKIVQISNELRKCGIAKNEIIDAVNKAYDSYEGGNL